ncbi:hypothetical protein Z051_21915 [Rhodococcus rhodochrous KG-21]|uniref:Uncharacterized protein n=1 Tax=Rhodococcus rhodochrous KG-21 TaxID=1441923 RepID=A0A0M8PKN3_RHORH|nr:hypothetical protein Z051_21915 [Rhodococcus rhodochrous KG-21]
MPSETVTVSAAVPVALSIPATVIVRVAPEPPKLTLVSGTNAGLLEDTDRFTSSEFGAHPWSVRS